MDNKHKKALSLIALSFMVAIALVKFPVQGTSWSLLPLVLGIFVAFISEQLVLSLGVAVLLGSFLDSYGGSQSLIAGGVGMVAKTSNYFWIASTDSTNQQILGFVFFILAMVHVMTISGGLQALVQSLQGWIVGPRSAQFVTFVLGCLIFIDDYTNTMVVGSTMKKVTDRYNISREKLAFLVDATSAPIAGIALVSTWIGYEVGLFTDMAEKFSWGVDGYAVFLDAIEFRYYCYLMLFFVLVNVLSGVDFGPMKSFAKSPIGKKQATHEDGPQSHILCSLLPLGLLLTLVFSLMWADGGGFSTHKTIFSITDWRQVLTTSQNGVFILLSSALVSYCAAVLTGLALSSVSATQLLASLLAAIKTAWLPIVILVLAWSLKEVCDDLNTGDYIVSLLSHKVNPGWVPLSIFIVSALTAFATGTSWGTMAILIPTVTPLAVAVSGGDYSVYVSLCLAAILDGAIMGDHCSPISDTTIMSCISTECDLLNHVKTQLPYSLIVGSLALIFGYIPAGFNISVSMTIPIALCFIVVLFSLLRNRSGLR